MLPRIIYPLAAGALMGALTACGPSSDADIASRPADPAAMSSSAAGGTTGIPSSEAANEPTPAERRLEWVRAPVSPSRTASLQTKGT
jgi:hypothetical protein